MLIDFSTVMKTLDGAPIKRPGTDADLKLSHVCCDALFAVFEDERNLGGSEKAERFVLATKIHDKASMDMSVDDVALLKKLVGKAFTALIVGQAYAVFDPKPASATTGG